MSPPTLDPIVLEVVLQQAHFGVAGGGDIRTIYPIVPHPTARGFIESLCGREHETMKDMQLAVGVRQFERSRGTILRKLHARSSSGDVTRPVPHHILWNPVYAIAVRGEHADPVRATLRGEGTRYGILSLGESDSAVDWISEDPVGHAQWLIPGTTYALPIRAGRGYRGQYVHKGFDLLKHTGVPDQAWITLP